MKIMLSLAAALALLSAAPAQAEGKAGEGLEKAGAAVQQGAEKAGKAVEQAVGNGYKAVERGVQSVGGHLERLSDKIQQHVD